MQTSPSLGLCKQRLKQHRTTSTLITSNHLNVNLHNRYHFYYLGASRKLFLQYHDIVHVTCKRGPWPRGFCDSCNRPLQRLFCSPLACAYSSRKKNYSPEHGYVWGSKEEKKILKTKKISFPN